MPRDAWRLYRVAAKDSGYAVVARVNGVVAGMARFSAKRSTLYAEGLWVARKFRRYGLARRMWGLAIKRLRPKKVRVTTFTPEGHAFFHSMAERHPDVTWDHRLSEKGWQ